MLENYLSFVCGYLGIGLIPLLLIIIIVIMLIKKG